MSMDWKLLAKPLAILGLTVLLGGLVIAALGLRYTQTQQNFLNVQAEHKQASARYHRAAADLALFAQYEERFLDYQRRGIIGEENRLSWAEALHAQDAALSLPMFNVAISPRQAWTQDNSPHGVQWFKSIQNIHASLLHEGDLLQILQALKDSARGLFRVANCQLKRNGEIQLSPQAANVDLDCTLHWYSVQIAARGQHVN